MITRLITKIFKCFFFKYQCARLYWCTPRFPRVPSVHQVQRCSGNPDCSGIYMQDQNPRDIPYSGPRIMYCSANYVHCAPC